MTSINRVSFFVMGFLSPLVLARLGSSDIVAPFIAFVLFIRFNPFQKRITCNRNDRMFVLASCFFLLVNDEFTDYMRTFFRDRIDRLKTFF